MYLILKCVTVFPVNKRAVNSTVLCVDTMDDDDPSPLLNSLSTELVKGPKVKDGLIGKESKTIDTLCFFMGLHQYFRVEESVLTARKGSKDAEMVKVAEEFRTHFMNSMLCIPHRRTPAGRISYSPFATDVDQFMVRSGREMCFKRTHPFASTKKKDAEFVVSVVSGFRGLVLERLEAEWKAGKSNRHGIILATGIVGSELLRSWANRHRCKMLSTLMTEIWAVDCCIRVSDLSESEQENAWNPVVRSGFWSVSMFYSQLDPKWDVTSNWEPTALIDTYLSVALPRKNYMSTVLSCIRRIWTSSEAKLKLEQCLDGMNENDIYARESVQGMMDKVFSLRVDSFYPAADTIKAYEECIYSVPIMLSTLSDMPYVEPPKFQAYAQPAASSDQRRESRVVEQVDSLLGASDVVDGFNAREWVDEGEDVVIEVVSRKQKKNQGQRRKLAKERQMQEVSSFLGELCDRVAVTVAKELIVMEEEELALQRTERERLERQRKEIMARKQARKKAEEEERLARKRAEEVERLAREARIKAEEAERLAREAREKAERYQRMAKAVFKETVESMIKEIAIEVVKEHNHAIAGRVQPVLLEQAKEGKLSTSFSRELVSLLLPGLESVLEPTVECFICLQPLNFAASPLLIRYLSCCDGGSFACPSCIAKHTTKHTLVAEQHTVLQTVSIRRQLKIGEFSEGNQRQ